MLPSNCSTGQCHNTMDNNLTDKLMNISGEKSQSNSDSEYVYVILTAVTSGLSIIGGATICILYVGFRDMRTPSRKLLFFLALSDAFLALGNLLGVIWYLYSDSGVLHKSHSYCAFQSAMTIYFSSTSFFWTVTMALNLFHAVVTKNASFAATYMKLFHVLAWIPPGIIVIIALGMDVLGTDTTLEQASWCWIDPRTPHVLVWQFATGKLWEIIAYVTVVALYATIKVFLKKQEVKKKIMIGPGKRKKSRKDIIAEANRKLTFVPFVFIVCRIWGTLRFLLGNFAVEYINEPYVTWINPLQGIGDSAQGFANCLLYCLSTEKIRNRIARVICSSRFITNLTTSVAANDSISKYSKRARVGVAGNASDTFTDVNTRNSGDQTESATVTNNDQSTVVTELYIDQSNFTRETNIGQSNVVTETHVDQSRCISDAINQSANVPVSKFDQPTNVPEAEFSQSTRTTETVTKHERTEETCMDGVDNEQAAHSSTGTGKLLINANMDKVNTAPHAVTDIFCVTKEQTVSHVEDNDAKPGRIEDVFCVERT